jgi:hypothetical protein
VPAGDPPRAHRQGHQQHRPDGDPDGREDERCEPPRHDSRKAVDGRHIHKRERREERNRDDHGCGDVTSGSPHLGEIARDRELALEKRQNAQVMAQLRDQLGQRRSRFGLFRLLGLAL